MNDDRLSHILLHGSAIGLKVDQRRSTYIHTYDSIESLCA